MGRYTCAICGKSYDNLCDYIVCVNECGEEAKKKAEMEQMNKMLKDIKELKLRHDILLTEFKVKYPEEYKMNFGDECYGLDADFCHCNDCELVGECEGCQGDECDCKIDHDCNGDSNCPDLGNNKNNVKDIELTYADNGKDKPKLSAKVNGKKVDDDSVEKLFEDSEVRHLAKLLGIL